MNQESTFYMTYARSRPDWIPKIASGDHDIRIRDGEIELVAADHDGMPLMTNALHRWSDAQEAFLDPWYYDTKHVIDSGGYNTQARFVKRNGDLKDGVSKSDVREQLDSEVPFFQWSVEQYHEWLATHAHEIEWAATMDYACEDRFKNLWSVEDAIDATIENAIRHFNLHNGEYELLPVLQGRSVDDYVECYDRLKEQGIPVTKVGLGTVCRLSSSQEIIEFEGELRSRRDFDHIHGFGVKRDSFSRGARFESADSQAWVWDASHGKELRMVDQVLVSSECDDSLRRTVVSFREYYRYLYLIRTGRDPLPPLRDDSQAVQATLSEWDPVLADGGEISEAEK